MPISWQDRLDCAATQADVVLVAKDFVAQFSAEKIHQLPWICRPRQFLDAKDVTAYAFSIVRNHGEGGAETAALIHQLASFFSDASITLSKLRGRSNRAQRAYRSGLGRTHLRST